RTRADASDADHLASEMDEPEVLEQVLAVALQGSTVGADQIVHGAQERGRLVRGKQLLDGDDQRWLADDPWLAVDEVRQLGERFQTVFRSGLRDDALRRFEVLPVEHRLQAWEAFLHAAVRIPNFQVTHGGELPHRGSIRARCTADDVGTLLGGEPVFATRDRQARGETLQVPFPRSAGRLVEIVDVEQELSLRRGEETEVRDVRVAARLNDEPRTRCRGEIGNHEVRGAAVERERRSEHPSVPDRNEFRYAALGLLLQESHRIRAAGWGFPAGVAGARNLGAGRLAPSGTLLGREVNDRGGGPSHLLQRVRIRIDLRRGRLLRRAPG